jgi:hypothetical protein
MPDKWHNFIRTCFLDGDFNCIEDRKVFIYNVFLSNLFYRTNVTYPFLVCSTLFLSR